jgi:hypothetical protein
LANSGHKSAAISLARQMKKSGNYSAPAMDTMIARLRPQHNPTAGGLASDTKLRLKNL